jgi:signal peptidase II
MAEAQREDGVKGLKLIGPFSRIGLAWAVPTFAFDQLSKWWILNVVQLDPAYPRQITPFLDLALAWNKGVSYSLLTSNSQEPLIALSLILSVALVLWLARAKTGLAALAFGLILGGALGNALDRVMHGAVADFVLLHWGTWNWYIFNVADVGIVAGVGLLVYDNLFNPAHG